jgi:DNA-binding transcriptional LysR family regulator
MNLNQLKIFYLASKLENLSRAAEELNITQPAVTKGIQRIQEFYEIKLVNRFGKKLVMTDAGKDLYRIAEKIFDLEAQAEENIREFQEQKKGHIRIQASESFGAYYLPAIINTFCKDHPLLRVSVNILPTETVIKNIAGLKTDIGFVSHRIDHEKVTCLEVLEDQMIFIAPLNDPLLNKRRLTVMDLNGRSMIVHEKGSVPSRAVMQFIQENKISISIPLELSSNRAILKAVADGLGIALVSRNVAKEEIRSGRLVELILPGLPLTRKFYIVYHKDKYLSAVLQQLIDQVNEWSAEYHRHLAEKIG